MDLESKLVDVNATSIDDLFDDTPDKTVGADDLLGGKKPEDNKKVEDKSKAIDPDLKLDDKTIDDLFDSTDDSSIEDSKAKDKKQDKEPSASKANSKSPDSLDYKSIYEYYVESGKWAPLSEEELEQVEWNEESFQNLWDSQWEYQVANGLNELVDSTGTYGKAIISYVQNGGNPEEIIDLFKEQKKLESLDVNTEFGQKEAISSYYKRIGWSDQKIDRHIKRLEIEGEESLKSEAEEVKSLHDEEIKQEVEKKNQAQQEYIKEQEAKERKFQANIVNTLKNRKDLTPQEKQEAHKAILAYDKKLPNGNTVNEFYVKFQEFISNPDNYVDLYQFIKDKDKFLAKLDKKAETKATIKTHRFLKNGGALSNKGGSFVETDKEEKDDFKFNYR